MEPVRLMQARHQKVLSHARRCWRVVRAKKQKMASHVAQKMSDPMQPIIGTRFTPGN